MRALVSILKLWTDFSTRFTQPRMTVWESDFPLVARSLPAIVGVSGPRLTRVREPRFHSQFLAPPRFDYPSVFCIRDVFELWVEVPEGRNVYSTEPAFRIKAPLGAKCLCRP